MTQPRILRFGPFRLDPTGARLSRIETAIPLPPKALAMLVHLVERPGRLVSKDELLDAVWGRRYVSEGVLKNTVRPCARRSATTPSRPRDRPPAGLPLHCRSPGRCPAE